MFPQRNGNVTNYGLMSTDNGQINVSGTVAVGPNARVESAAETPEQASRPHDGWDVGVITALSVETSAVVAMLQRAGAYIKRTAPSGHRFHEAHLSMGTEELAVVATQMVSPGQRSAMAAFQSLRDAYSPAYVALVGIAGAIHPDIGLGDVVIAREVVYYDLRKETPQGVRRRGESLQVPAAVLHAVNDFFAESPGPLTGAAPGGGARPFQVLSGPIGSGEAVVADPKAGIRRFLSSYNDKTLALETEAGGIAQAFYEGVTDDAAPMGWFAVRGISDTADQDKNDDFHSVAAQNAATVLERLLPYLVTLG